MQLIIVTTILIITALLIARHYYLQFTGKRQGCNCCPHGGGQCHCHDCTSGQ